MQHSLNIPSEAGGQRLDVFLAAMLEGESRASLQRHIKEGGVLLDGRPTKPGAALKAGSLLEWNDPVSAPPPTEARPEDIPLDVLFEDTEVIVINKPAGIVTHPAAGNWDGTIVNAILHHAGNLSTGGDPLRPGIVHRLDKETSGCLVIAKTEKALRHLAAQFENRVVTKEYLAITSRVPKPEKGRIETPIARHPVHRKKMTVVDPPAGRSAITIYESIAGKGALTLVHCRLLTGRTHQIRVHLKHVGAPIAGDEVYGTRGSHERQLLHAWRLGFQHPATGAPMGFEAPIPSDFQALGFGAVEAGRAPASH